MHTSTMLSTLWGSKHIHHITTCMLVESMYRICIYHLVSLPLDRGSDNSIIILVLYLFGSSTRISNWWLLSLLNTIRCYQSTYLLLDP
jgi:hypothetical protein